METLGYLLASITAVYLWTDKITPVLFLKRNKLDQYSYRNKFTEWIDRKPINCGTCLSFWIGLILFFIFDYQIFYLSLPLFYKLIYKQL